MKVQTPAVLSLVIALALTCVAHGQEKQESATNRAAPAYIAAELKVLDTFGTATKAQFTLDAGVHSIDGMKNAEEYFNKNIASIVSQKISTHLKPLTQKIGAIEGDSALLVWVSAPQELAAIQKLLGPATGKPETVKEDDGTETAWHKYGWLSFGVAGGKVLALRAKCIPQKP